MSGIMPRREGLMYDEATTSLGGDVKEKPAKVKKPSRAARIEAWKKENKEAYREACEAHCVCTPTRAQMLLIDQWARPPVD